MAEVLTLSRAADEQRLVATIHRARRWSERLVGLLGRHELGDDEGLWITPCNSIHTCGMRYAIDVLFLDSELCIVRTRENVAPWRFAAARASSVVELAAGSIARHELNTGEQLRLTQRAPFENNEESLA